MKKITLLLPLVLLLGLAPIHAEELTDKKKALIDTLLGQMGQSASESGLLLSESFVKQMTMVVKQQNPDIDSRAFDVMEEEINSIIQEEFVKKNTLNQLMYPIYGKRFSESELEELIAFNQTDLGKKLVHEMPAITQEGMMAGQQIGQKLVPVIQQRVAERLSEEGFEI